MRLLDLPPPILVWVTFLSASSLPVIAQSSNSSTTSTTSTTEVNVGSYIVSGLGGGAEATNASLTAVPAATGTGYDYASSCNAASYAYSSASAAYGNDNYYNVTNTTTFAYTYTTASAPPSTHATSLTTLCDGHARVVGRATISNASSWTVTSAETYPVTFSISATNYPRPSPTCSIGTSDCSLLWDAYRTSVSAAQTQDGGYYERPPLCNTKPATTSTTGTCNFCQIVAASARLLYWPVTTVPGSGDLCNKTAATITKTPTGPPSSFVTSGLTITSPTVALSFGGLARIDECGTKTDTIVAVNPDEVATVRGYRAFFSHYQFNYADLNYDCASNSSDSSIPDWERDDCYQAVPADAYFGGLQEASKNWMNGSDGLTIWPDYHPQVLVPDTMMPAISSIWGKGCSVHPLGVWDPPVALTQQSTVDGVTTPAQAPATTTTAEEPPSSATGPAKLDPQGTADAPTKPTQGLTTTTSTSMVTAAYPQIASTQTQLAGDPGSTSIIIPAPSPVVASTQTKLSVQDPASHDTISIAYSPAIASTQTKLIVPVGGPADPGTTVAAGSNGGGAAGVLVSLLGGTTEQGGAQQVTHVQDPAQASQGPAGALVSIIGGGDGVQTAIGGGAQAQQSHGSNDPAVSGGGAQAQQSQGYNGPAASGASQTFGVAGAQTTANQQGSATQAIADPASASLTQAIALGSQTVTITRPSSSPRVAIIADITLSQGGSAATISGHSVTMASSGVVLVDGVTASAASSSSPSGTQSTGSPGSSGTTTIGSGSGGLSGLPTISRAPGSQTGPSATSASGSASASASGTTNAGSMKMRWSIFGISGTMAAVMAVIMI